MVDKGIIRLTSQSALIMIAHEALHGWVYSFDPDYFWRAHWRNLFDKTGPYAPYGGFPHHWVDSKAIKIGVWVNDKSRTPRPDISEQSYRKCINGAGCK